MPYVMGRTIDDLMSLAYHFAPCGLKSVEDAVKKYCADHKIEVDGVDVSKVHGETVQVYVRHHDAEWPRKGTQHTSFEVCNPSVNFPDWASALEFIRRCQKAAPPHLAGLPHNAGEELTRTMTEWLAGKTGMELHLGDVWVHVADGKELLYDDGTKKCIPAEKGHVHLGQVTHAGSVAMQRYAETLGK